MKLCSACLLGLKCRYDGQSKVHAKVINLASQEILIPVCPEQMGGLSTPRTAAEIKDGCVVTTECTDVTKEFELGAEEVLKIAKLYDIKEAILKQRSPSCGCGLIYDGTFSDNIIKGDGITTKLLKENGINVITEEDL